MKRTRIKFKPKRNPISQATIVLVEIRSGGVCEVPGCRQRATQKAHIKHRGMGGAQGQRAEIINSHRNIFDSCQYHHDLIDRRIRESFTGERELVLEAIKNRIGYIALGLV